MVTMANVRMSFGQNRVVSGENDIVFTTPGPVKPPLVFCHQRGASALSCLVDVGCLELFYDLAEYYTVIVTDLGGGDTWGNNTALSRIGSAKLWLQNNYGTSGKIGLVGISMGGLAVLNFAKANPSLVAFVCGIVPAMHTADIRNYDSATDSNTGSAGTYASVIDAAYTNGWSDATYGPDYAPYVYRLNYPSLAVKTGIWSSPVDKICRPQFHQIFVRDNPKSDLYSVRDSAGVGPSHNLSIAPAVRGNPSGPYYFPKPADWCAQRRLDTTF